MAMNLIVKKIFLNVLDVWICTIFNERKYSIFFIRCFKQLLLAHPVKHCKVVVSHYFTPQPTLSPSSCLSACLEKIVLSIYRVKNTEQSPERLCEINKRSLVRVAYVLQPRRDRWRSFLRIESIGSKVDSVQLCPLKINKPTGFFQMIINIFHELDVDTLRMIFYIGRSLNDRMILKLR